MRLFRGVTKGDFEHIKQTGTITPTKQISNNVGEVTITCLAENEHDAIVYANRKIHSGEPCLEPKEPVVMEIEVPPHIPKDEASFEDDGRKRGYVAYANLSASFIIRASPAPKMTLEEVFKELKE